MPASKVDCQGLFSRTDLYYGVVELEQCGHYQFFGKTAGSSQPCIRPSRARFRIVHHLLHLRLQVDHIARGVQKPGHAGFDRVGDSVNVGGHAPESGRCRLMITLPKPSRKLGSTDVGCGHVFLRRGRKANEAESPGNGRATFSMRGLSASSSGPTMSSQASLIDAASARSLRQSKTPLSTFSLPT